MSTRVDQIDAIRDHATHGVYPFIGSSQSHGTRRRSEDYWQLVH
jgi:hypothetical protein